MKFKYFSILLICVLTSFVGLGFAGCGDIYENLRVTVDSTSVSLRLPNDTNTGEEDGSTTDGTEDNTTNDDTTETEPQDYPISTTITARVEGASGDMLKSVDFWYEDNSVVSAEVISLVDNVSTIRLTAQGAGSTRIRIISREYSGAVSPDILVTVYRDATDMEFNTSSAPSVAIGGQLVLNTNDLINFYVNGEQTKIYPSQATFSLMSVDDTRWNTEYGTTQPSGVILEGNTLTASEDAQCGIVQLVATMPNGLSVPVYVMVYEPINTDQIYLMQNDTIVEEINTVINPFGIITNSFQLNAYVDSIRQNFNMRIVSNDTDILVVGTPNQQGRYNVAVSDSGKTTLTVFAEVVDPVTNIVYRSFSKDYDVTVTRIVTDIYISAPNVEPTSDPVSMTVQDSYTNGVLGAEVHFKVSEGAADGRIQLAVTQVDGAVNESGTSNDVVIYDVNGQVYNWGDFIEDDSTFYVALSDTNTITRNFVLELRANTYDENMPVATNQITFTIDAGVTEITPSREVIAVEVGGTTQFGLNFVTTEGPNQGSPSFSFEPINPNVASIQPNDNYIYTVTGLAEGDTTVLIEAESGAYITITIQVKEIPTEFYLTIPQHYTVSNIVQTQWNEEGNVNQSDGMIDEGVRSFTIEQNTSIDVSYFVAPENITINSIIVNNPVTSDTNNEYVTVSSFTGNSFTLIARRATDAIGPITVTVNFQYYAQRDGVWETRQGYRTIEVSVYKPISYFYWNNSNRATTIYESLYNINHLNINQQNLATTTIGVTYDTTASYFINGGTINWSTNDESKITITEQDNSTISITAHLTEEDTASSYKVLIYGRVTEYNNINRILTCEVTIINPLRVSNIQVTNYNNSEGIRLNDLGTEAKTRFEMSVQITPYNAFNTNLGYKIYNAVYDPTTMTWIAGEEYLGSQEDAVVILDENNPNIIIANNAGRAVVRIYALDGETSNDVDYSAICHTDVWVVVEDGSEANPYTIDTAEEFIAIGDSAESMTKHYTVRQSIDLSRYEGYFPLGKDNQSNGVFSGTITSFSYASNGTKQTITGIPLCTDFVGVGNSSYLGIFAQIDNATSPAISNLDFYFNNGLIDLSAVDSTNIYIGLLAGNIMSDIENVFVNFTSYTVNAITINTSTMTNTQNLYFGVVAGNYSLDNGSVNNVRSNIAVNFNLADSTALVAGGLFGAFLGLELGQESNLMSNVYITATRQANTLTDYVGGLIGDFRNGTLKSMQASGRINAPNLNNVGGLVGRNSAILGEYVSDTNAEYRNLANVKVSANNNVGGLVGYNEGTIRYSRAENYDSVNVTDGNTLIFVQGKQNVGGLVGYNSGALGSGLITYSYAMSYIDRNIVNIENQTDIYSYYGDIVGESNVGGLVGNNENATILNSFASINIQQTTNSGNVGGLIGRHYVENSSSRLFAGFAVGSIYTINANTSQVGELVGYLFSNAQNLVEQQYAFVEITIYNGGQESNLYNLAGTITQTNTVSASYYYDGSITESNVSSGTIGAWTLEDMQNSAIYGEVYQNAQWGFGQGNDWVDYDETVGVNNNMPILYDQDGEWLYTQSINAINVQTNTYRADGNRLDSYFGVDYIEGGDNKQGAVVILDMIATNNLGQKVINLYDVNNMNSLFNITVAPEGLDPEDWQLSVISSNYDIVEVVQPSQNLIGTQLIFKSTGIVTLTFRSLLNVNAYTEITINVLGGFNNYDILDGNDNSILGQDFYVKTERGYALYPEFTQRDSSIGNSETLGIVYSVTNTQFVAFENVVYQEGSNAYIPNNMATLLRGLQASNDNFFTIGVAPYVELIFGGQTINYAFNDLGLSFRVKVYDGISSVGLDATEAQLESGENLILKLNVETDNVQTVVIKDVQVVLDEEVLSRSEADKYVTLQDTEITDTGIVNSYNLQLAEEYRFITENIYLTLNFTVSDDSGDVYNLSLPLIYAPATIKRIDVNHYTYGATSMEGGESASNLISPGTTGVLKIEVTPEYAWYDNLIVSSSTDSVSGDYVRMVQLVYRNGVYRTIPGGTLYDENGNLVAQKVTGIDERGNEYFNGIVYVSTLISTVVTEGTTFDVTVAPVREGVSGYLITPVVLRLVTTFAPYANITLDSNYSGDIVARGTVANLHLTGVLQNSTLEITASYGSNASLSVLQRCVIGEYQSRFMTGEREPLDMVVPFYVGILAAPDNGIIIITVTITSRTDTGAVLNPLILTYTLNIVDFIVDSVYAEDTNNNELNSIAIRTYTTLRLNWNLVTPISSDFRQYISDRQTDVTAFNAAVSELMNKTTRKLATLNARTDGSGGGGIWYYNSGGGYTQLSTNSTYTNFVFTYDEFQDGSHYYLIRGRSLANDLHFRLSFESYYLYDYATGCYTFAIDEDLTEENQNLLLASYVRLLERDFDVDVINDTTDDSPEPIDSAQTFSTMTEGVSYMLTADIHLYNWTPIETAITSLDGNGYIIYLHSFATNVDTTSANYGLWSTLPSGTVLKNLIVEVSHNIYVDLQNVSSVNFGFIAGVNEGVIYNSEVVVTETKEGWKEIYDNTTQVVSTNADFQFGINIFNQIYQGMNGVEPYNEFDTLSSTFILTSRTTTSGATVTSNVGGLVGTNNGSIANSRVGKIDTGNSLILNGNRLVYARQGLNIFASGNVGGLVGTNTGTISNSYYANGYVINSMMDIYSSTNTTGARTGGLVAVQTETGRITGSYARGQLDDETPRSSLGGVVAYGTIGGLVHSNAGEITNSYSNMTLSSSNGMGGFVYENTGNAVIKYSYSLSNVQTQGLINGVFIGLDNEGNLLDGQNTTVLNCYYLTDENLIVDSQERAIGLTSKNWSDSSGSAFDGFVISGENSSTTDAENTTWYIDSNRAYLGPQLTLADREFMSLRTIDDGYIYANDYILGSANNPDIITSLSDWQDKVFNYTSDSIHSGYMTATGSTNAILPRYEFGNYYVMLLNDINFGGSIDDTTSSTIFKGKLFGNGHIISGLNYTQPSTVLTTPNDFGLFNQLDGAVVSNLNLIIDTQLSSRARRIGVLAGTINDSIIENINITGANRTAEVMGTNLSGALAGFVSGSTEIYNVTSTLSASSISATAITSNSTYTYYYSGIPYNSTYSYAGGIIGVLDLDEAEESSDSRVRNLLVTSYIMLNNTRYSGSIDIYGEIVGGVIGLIGSNSEAYQVYFDIDEENPAKIRGRNFAGGIVGENRGSLLNSRISIPDEDRMAIDSGILSTDDATDYIGYTELFSHEDTTNAIGGLVGLNVGGLISNSYSRVAVTAENAKVAGGIIGLSINAPLNYNPTATSVDPTLNYLRQLGSTNGEILTNLNVIEYTLSGNQLRVDDTFRFGAILNQVYTTGAVNASEAIGGLVGAQIGAPIYTQTISATIAAINNNFDSRDSTFVSKLQNENVYVGSITGFLGYEISQANQISNIAFVGTIEQNSSYSLGNVATNIKGVTLNLDAYTLNAVGNIPNLSTINIVSTNFIKAATSVEDQSFNGFNENVWNLDEEKLNHRFPNLSLGYDLPVVEVSNADEFFDALEDTQNNTSIRIVADFDIRGIDWENYVRSTSPTRYSIGTYDSPVRGRVEGAVIELISGQETTRAATITFRDFNSTQMRSFHSLFGYTRSFWLINVNFVFTFNFDATGQELDSFALLSRESISSTFDNISVSFNNNTTYSVNNTNNVAVITAEAQDCSFSNVRLNVTMNATNYTSYEDALGIEDSTSVISIGGLFATGDSSNEIAGSDFGNININYSSVNDYVLTVGSLVGISNGILNLIGTAREAGNISGAINVNLTASNSMSDIYLGGAVGNSYNNSSVNLRNFATNVDLNLNKTMNSIGVNYVGGILGNLISSTISNASSLGDISVEINGGNSYIGGIAGLVRNVQNFNGPSGFTGLTTNIASSYGNIDVSGTSYQLYIGGIYGNTQEQVTLSDGATAPSGQSRSIYSTLYSEANINADVTATYSYIGGIIGLAEQGVLDQASGGLTPFTPINNVLRISSVSYVGDLLVSNESTDGASYVGGIVGYSYLTIEDALSSGVVSFNSNNDARCYVGGIVGFAENHVVYALALSVIQVGKYTENVASNVDAIIGGVGNENVTVQTSYYSSDMTGIFSSFGTNLSVNQVYSEENCALIIANLPNWTYTVTQTNNNNSVSVLYPTNLSVFDKFSNLTSGDELVPVYVNNINMLSGYLSNNQTHKTIILANDIEVVRLYRYSLENTRRLIGNGHSLLINNNYVANVTSQNYGMFEEIPRTALISNLGVDFEVITLNANTQSSLGILAGKNYGTIYNVSIGSLATYDSGYLDGSMTVADFANGAKEKYNTNMLSSQEIATMIVNASGNDTISVGGIVGENYGLITGVFTSLDIVITSNDTTTVNVGSFAGLNQNAYINNSMTNGRINLTGNSIFAGGIGGANNASLFEGCIVNTNITTYQMTDNIGLAFGTFNNSIKYGIIVNSNISGNSALEEFNDYYDYALTDTNLNSNTAMSYIRNSANLFRQQIWARSTTANYGYPYLNINQTLSFSTGDGTINNPYQLNEAVQLQRLRSASNSTYYCLTRDMLISSQVYEQTSQTELNLATFNGMGHVVVIHDITTTQDSTNYIGLFESIRQNTIVSNLGVVICNDLNLNVDAQFRYGSLAVTNYGTITNSFAISNGTINFTNSQSNSRVGGLVSQNYGAITNSFADVNFIGRDGYFGGLVGILGNETGNDSSTRQATISRSFASGDITLNNSASTQTSAGGLVGANYSFITNGYAIQDSYVYGTCLLSNVSGLNMGTLIGYSAVNLNTRSTYSYAFTPGPRSGYGEYQLYENMGMVGNQASLSTRDETSIIAVFLAGVPYERGNSATSADVSLVDSISVLRNTRIGLDVYAGWSTNTWGQNAGGGNDTFIPYLIGVTPLDRREVTSADTDALEIFGIS